MHLHRSTALKEIEENSWLCFFHFPNVKNWSSWSFISDLHFENCVWGDGEWHEHFFLSTGDFLTRSSAPRPGLHLKNSWKLPSSSWGKAAGRSLQGRSCPHIGDSFGASCYGRASSWVDSCWAMWAGAGGRGGHPVSPWGLVAQPERLQLPSGCPFLCSFPRL